MKITIVKAEEWEGAYMDNDILLADHRIEIQWLVNWSNGQPFILQIIEASKKLEEYIQIYNRLPDKLNEVMEIQEKVKTYEH